MSDKPSALISRAGFGKQGYCKLCSFVDLKALNDKIIAKWNARQIIDWLSTNYGETATRATIYNHRDNHMSRAEDRLVTAVQKQRASGHMMPRVSSNEQFLEAIRDIGYQRAIDNPEEVTIDHGLKAAATLANSKRSSGEITLILARVSVGADYSNVIEGEAVEVPVQ